MEASIQGALDNRDIHLNVKLYRMYGENRSAGFELKDPSTDEVVFTMDIDVNRPKVPTRIYEVEGIRFNGIILNQMIADKVSVISTDKVFRRIKDLVDLYYYSQVFGFNKDEITKLLNNSGREMGDFNGFNNRIDELEHSYTKFRFSGDVEKPEFKTYHFPTKNLPKTYFLQKIVSSAVDLYRPVSKFSRSFSAHLINVLGEFAATGIHLTET